METRRWTNPSQPQTLYMATFLLYIEAFFNVIGFGGLPFQIGIVVAVGQVAGAMGIANEKRWGYYLGVGVAGLVVLLILLLVGGLANLFSLDAILALLFPVALFALLMHPMSREYQKIWFH